MIQSNCETIFDKASKAQNCDQNQGCQFCDNLSQIINGVPKCNQCTRGLYLHEGKCYNSCPNGYIGETTNFTCAKKSKLAWSIIVLYVLTVILLFVKNAREVNFYIIISAIKFALKDLEQIESHGHV